MVRRQRGEGSVLDDIIQPVDLDEMLRSYVRDMETLEERRDKSLPGDVSETSETQPLPRVPRGRR